MWRRARHLRCGASMPLSSSDPSGLFSLSRSAETDVIWYAALSLTPFGWRRRTAERLLDGQSPRRVLDRLIAERPRDGIDLQTLAGRAAVALTRARHSAVAVVTWGDPSYPAALS